mmetsp:Transcript_1286/g.3697  ORF Transcript_1286/g.3697 Transcript_1286/m.3697 type:complete len:248 (-) Transcript_1286:1227-1970(-)
MQLDVNAAPWWKVPAVKVVQALKQGQVTPLQLLDVAEQRISATDKFINACPTLCFDRARHAARQMEMKGHPVDPGPGYLYGLPIVIKDTQAVSGVRFTEGSPIYAERIADWDDPLVAALERQGGIVMAKTNTPEFAAGSNTYNPVFGRTRNPWDTRKTCGGSSGGSAAAVSCGQAWMASGSDLGGSCRIPGSFCGCEIDPVCHPVCISGSFTVSPPPLRNPLQPVAVNPTQVIDNICTLCPPLPLCM